MKTVKIKLKPTKEQSIELMRLSKEYTLQANLLVERAATEGSFPKVSSKDIDANLPSVVKNELIRYAKTKYKQFGKCVFKKRTVSWNNQNFNISAHAISFPMIVDGKTKKAPVRALIPPELFAKLNGVKLGALRIAKKGIIG